MPLDLALWQQRFREDLLMRNGSPVTARGYIYELARFFAFLEDERIDSLSDITRDVVEGYRRHIFYSRSQRGGPVSARTQSGRLSAVKAFLRYLARESYLLIDPGQGVDLPRGPRTLPRNIPNEQEVVRMVEAPNTATILGLRNRAILELLYASAIRNSELLALQVSDVRFDRTEVHVRLGKGAKDRILPIGQEAAHWILRYLREARPHLIGRPDETALFLSSKKNRLGTIGLIALVAAAGERAGIRQRMTPHALRHACATHMLERGAELRHLQEFLGHESPDPTQRYARVVISDLRAMHKRFHPRERRQTA